MKKQTFYQLEHSQEILTADEAKEILGGNGVITSGSGTSTDPYVISVDFFYYDDRSKEALSGLTNYLPTLGDGGVINDGPVGGGESTPTYYKFNVTGTDVRTLPGAPFATDTAALKSFAIGKAGSDYVGSAGMQVTKGQVLQGGDNGSTSAGPVWGYSSILTTTINYNAIDNAYAQPGFSQGGASIPVSGSGNVTTYSKSDFILNTFMHEFVHRVGGRHASGGVETEGHFVNDINSNHIGLVGPPNMTVTDISNALANKQGVTSSSDSNGDGDVTYYFN
ncbi:MAG: hypothetical protein JWR50_2065 [Mucilaginibacter sp.]|nr:hypothetical protein [Mucilaginibacter sp.]